MLGYQGNLTVPPPSKEGESPSNLVLLVLLGRGGGVTIFSLKLFCIAELSLHAEF